jgi:DNA polymerase-1
MPVDAGALQRMSGELAGEIDSLQARADSEAGEPVKLGSTKELARILFDVRGLEPLKRGKTGPSTDAESLEAIHAATADPLCGIILRWRELTKLKSTYVDALPALIDPGTGRIHTTLHQDVASTGRLSSSDPNLQNIPVRTELGRRIRSAFAAPEGFRLVAGDYSQIELRVLAHYSRDENLCAAFREGQDIHSRVAAEIEGVDLAAVTGDMRRRAKAVNFGIVYGQSAFGLARELGISRQDAQTFIDGYFENFPGVRAFIDETIERAGREGEVRTLAGRRRPIPELKARDQARRGLAERTAVNTVIQGSAADIIKLAMIALDERIARERRPERMLLQIHDELLLECPEDATGAAESVLADTLSTIVEIAVPLVVNTSSAADWGAISK